MSVVNYVKIVMNILKMIEIGTLPRFRHAFWGFFVDLVQILRASTIDNYQSVIQHLRY